MERKINDKGSKPADIQQPTKPQPEQKEKENGKAN